MVMRAFIFVLFYFKIILESHSILQNRFPPNTFTKCQKNISIAGYDSLSVYSPNYPNIYTPGTACEYMISTVSGYGLDFYCEIDFYEDPGSGGCNTEYFLLSEEEDPSLDNAQVFCGSVQIRRASLFLTATIAYISQSNFYVRRGGNFRCEFKSKPRPCDCGWSLQRRIVGGQETQINEFPFMAGIVRISSHAVVCGGSIITDRYVLTSAHCLAGADNNICDLALLIGDHNYRDGNETPYSQLLAVARIILHENYTTINFSNDIGLAQTREEMRWSRGIGPGCLPFLNRYETFVGYNVEIVGWGTTSFAGPTSDALQKGITTITSNDQCSTATSTNINPSLFCTYQNGTDSCQGDSGGPVVLKSDRMFVLGVIASGATCSGLGFNERVTFYLDWIVSHTQQSFCAKSIY